MKYGKQRIGRRIISSPITLIALLLILFVMTKAAFNVYSKAKLSEANLNQAQSELAALEARQSDLQNKVNYLSTEEGIDAEMREKYHAVRPGESLVVVVDDTKTQDKNASTTPEKMGIFKRLFRFVGL